MKKLLLCIFLLLTLNLLGQVEDDALIGKISNLKLHQYSEKDTIPIVVYPADKKKDEEVLWKSNR